MPVRPPFMVDVVDKLREAVGLYEKANARVLAAEVRKAKSEHVRAMESLPLC